ncbi:hypothetical protein [Endozoicomonas arenosclerae]|uniref:hypothetical protein n=1 Tax=Endozoicomonas arenosclerae TaxID=1633495 RepID=UPI0007850835|nr:hypothetical protein [Endozoicomonas arenosclerae]
MDIDDIVLEDIPLELLQTPARFARATGLSEHVVRHWVADGVLPTYRIGRRVLINLPKLKQQLLNSATKKKILNNKKGVRK